jgi:hypothetical protein
MVSALAGKGIPMSEAMRHSKEKGIPMNCTAAVKRIRSAAAGADHRKIVGFGNCEGIDARLNS